MELVEILGERVRVRGEERLDDLQANRDGLGKKLAVQVEEQAGCFVSGPADRSGSVAVLREERLVPRVKLRGRRARRVGLAFGRVAGARRRVEERGELELPETGHQIRWQRARGHVERGKLRHQPLDVEKRQACRRIRSGRRHGLRRADRRRRCRRGIRRRAGPRALRVERCSEWQYGNTDRYPPTRKVEPDASNELGESDEVSLRVLPIDDLDRRTPAVVRPGNDGDLAVRRVDRHAPVGLFRGWPVRHVGLEVGGPEAEGPPKQARPVGSSGISELCVAQPVGRHLAIDAHGRLHDEGHGQQRRDPVQGRSGPSSQKSHVHVSSDA